MKTKLLNSLKTIDHTNCTSIALLFIRLVIGSALITHGWGKIQNPLAWMGPESTVPGFFQFLAALSEFGGGIAWIFGLLTPIASFGIGFTMLVATIKHVTKDPFAFHTYELAIVYLVIAIAIFLMGPGKFSLDAMIFKKRP